MAQSITTKQIQIATGLQNNNIQYVGTSIYRYSCKTVVKMPIEADGNKLVRVV